MKITQLTVLNGAYGTWDFIVGKKTGLYDKTVMEINEQNNVQHGTHYVVFFAEGGLAKILTKTVILHEE